MKKIFKNKIYLEILSSDVISNFGDTVYYLALMNYALLLPNSSLAIAIITFSESLPVLGTFLTGYFADGTTNKLRYIQLTLIFRILLYGIISLIIGLNPQMWILVFACLINFVSDVAGQFENSLYYPIINRIVSNEDREEIMAFRQTVSSSFTILFQSIGGILITFLSFQLLSIINVLSFVISLLILFSLKEKLEKILLSNEGDRKVKIGKNLLETISDIFINLKASFSLLINIPKVKNTLLMIQIVNSSLSVILPLSLLLISKDQGMVMVNNAYTISALSLAITLGTIVGGALTVICLKNIAISTIIRLESVTLVFLFISAYIHNIYFILVVLFVSSLFVGSLNPKIGALIFNNIPEDRLATAFGGIATFFQLSEVISKWVFSFLIIFMPSVALVIIFIVINVITCIFSFRKKRLTSRFSLYHRHSY